MFPFTPCPDQREARGLRNKKLVSVRMVDFAVAKVSYLWGGGGEGGYESRMLTDGAGVCICLIVNGVF